MQPNLVAVYPQSLAHSCNVKAELLAQQLQLPLVKEIDSSFPYLLVITDQRIELQQTNTKTKPICVDFLAAAYQRRLSLANTKNEFIAKAVGVGKTKNLTVIDATAGVGEDSFLLAKLGCNVRCLERSKIIATLLQDGIERFLQVQPSTSSVRFSLIVADAIEYLNQLPEAEYPDVIYLDPMFPSRQKSAFVKKEMRMLRDIVGYDLDAAELLSIALRKAKQRVVVKRPRLAPSIEISKRPDWVLIGKSSRFDGYNCLIS